MKVANRDHNPLKTIVQRIQFFLGDNKQDLRDLLHSLTHNSSLKVTTSIFANFLKQKIDKKRSLPELEAFVSQMDIDGDGYVDIYDL